MVKGPATTCPLSNAIPSFTASKQQSTTTEERNLRESIR